MWCVEHADAPEMNAPKELTPVFWNTCKMCIKSFYFTLWSLKMHAGVLCLNMVCVNSSCKEPSDKWHLHSAQNTHIWLTVTNRQKQDHTGVKCSKSCWIFHDQMVTVWANNRTSWTFENEVIRVAAASSNSLLKKCKPTVVCSFTCLKKLNKNARVQKQGSHNCNQYHRMTHPHTWSSRLFTDSHLSFISILHMHTHMHMWCIKLCRLTSALASYFWRQNATKYQTCPLFWLSLVLTTSVQDSNASTVVSSLV